MKKRFNLKFWLILIVINGIAIFPSLVSASDVLVWQGQYYTGTTFNTGTHEFNFSVYDALTGGDICYSNTTSLTTGSFGEWKTEQTGVNSACNNVSKDYYLNINIGDVDQSPRRRLVVWDSLRKNVDEITISSFEADIIKVRTGLKDLNKAIWQSKLNYARELANTSLVSQRNVALKLITTTTTTTGESTESKIIKIQQAGEQAITMINSEFEIAQAKILEAKKLALLNGEKPEDVAAIEAEANLNLITLNLTAQEQVIIVEQALNESIDEVIASDDGIRFCLSNGTNCNVTQGPQGIHGINGTNGINGVNGTNGASYNQVLNTTSNVTFNTVNATNGFFTYLGSLINRITKLFVQDIDASGNVNVSGNVTASHFIGDGSYLTGICQSNGTNCMSVSNGTNGLTPVYLASNLTATSAAYTTIFTVALTPSKINIIQAYLAQSSPTAGVAIQNMAIISEAGPIGYCHFTDQTQAGTEVYSNIVVSTNAADTGTTAMGLDINVPFINTVTCTVLADANQKNLIIQFDSETAATVTTYAGSYYTNAVN